MNLQENKLSSIEDFAFDSQVRNLSINKLTVIKNWFSKNPIILELDFTENKIYIKIRKIYKWKFV